MLTKQNAGAVAMPGPPSPIAPGWTVPEVAAGWPAWSASGAPPATPTSATTGTVPPQPGPAAHAPPRLALAVVAAHGGCGTTTVAAALGGAVELAAGDVRAAMPAACAVVAATTPDGLTAAAVVLRRLAGEGMIAVRLVLVGDGRGPVPTSVRARAHTLSSHVAGVHLLPYVRRWRYQDREARTPSPPYDRALRAFVAALSAGQAPGLTTAVTAPHATPTAPPPSPQSRPSFTDLPTYPSPTPAVAPPGTAVAAAGGRW